MGFTDRYTAKDIDGVEPQQVGILSEDQHLDKDYRKAAWDEMQITGSRKDLPVTEDITMAAANIRTEEMFEAQYGFVARSKDWMK